MDDQLLMRYISGDVTDDEKIRITEWLDADPEHMRKFLILRKLYDITVWQEQPSVANPGKGPAREKAGAVVRKLTVEFLKVAAIFILVFLGIRYFSPVIPKPEETVAMHTIHVPAGQHTELVLTDGTKVWLNTGTTFTFPEHFSSQTREVKLDGEGYFEVAKNEASPFSIQAGKYHIKVLGTEFNVAAYSGDGTFETSLLEGSIELTKTGSADKMIIHPNERVFLENDQLVRGPIVNYNQFLWKEGLISFNDESFPEMIRKLELYFDVKITVKNDHILNYRCTGKFRTKDGIRHILKVLQLNNDFRYEIDDTQNTITIE
jgi:ferric-dicitrate binding protein FerR (iron transport regulator)